MKRLEYKIYYNNVHNLVSRKTGISRRKILGQSKLTVVFERFMEWIRKLTAEITTKCHLKQTYMPGLSLVTLFHAHCRVLAKTDFEEQCMQSPNRILFVEIYPGLPKIKNTPNEVSIIPLSM